MLSTEPLNQTETLSSELKSHLSYCSSSVFFVCICNIYYRYGEESSNTWGMNLYNIATPKI